MNCTCIHKPESDFYIDADGAALPAGAVIICREIDVVYQARDEEFSYLETHAQEQKAEKQGGLFTSIYRTVMGNCRKTCRKKITGIPDTLQQTLQIEIILQNNY